MTYPKPADIGVESPRRRFVWLCGPIACICASFAPLVATAATIIHRDLTVVENRPVDDFFGFPGLHLLTRIDASHTGGPGALTGPPANAKVSSNRVQVAFLAC